MEVSGDPELWKFAGGFSSPDGYDLFLRELFKEMYCPAPSFSLPNLKVAGTGDKVFAYGVQCMQAKRAPEPIVSHLIFHFTFRCGKIAHIRDEYFKKYVPDFLNRQKPEPK